MAGEKFCSEKIFIVNPRFALTVGVIYRIDFALREKLQIQMEPYNNRFCFALIAEIVWDLVSCGNCKFM